MFLYLLGDCIYFYGEESQYFPQFYDPYAQYNLPIFAISGNHDGEPLNASQTSLDGFVQNLCTANPQANSAASDSGRTTMTQPNVYWTLDTPLATIIGLYTNVPEGGHLDDTQVAWLNYELTSAPAGKALLVTMHHPPISADDHYGSSPYMMQLLDTAMQTTSRLPDLICAGHVHDFQRHTRDASAVGGTGSLTYLVAGAGGYHNLHTIAADVKALTLPAPFPGMTGVMIEAFCDDHYGYLRLKVSPSQIDLQYVSVSPQPGVAPSAINPTVIDSATIPVRGG